MVIKSTVPVGFTAMVWGNIVVTTLFSAKNSFVKARYCVTICTQAALLSVQIVQMHGC